MIREVLALSHRLDYEFLIQDISKMILWKIDVDSKQQSKSSIEFHTLGKYTWNTYTYIETVQIVGLFNFFILFVFQGNCQLIVEYFTIFCQKIPRNCLVISWKGKIGFQYLTQECRQLRIMVQNAKVFFCGNVFLKYLISVKSCFWIEYPV